MNAKRPLIQRALISASDKTGLASFAQQLAVHGIEIIATSGTANFLKQHGVTCIELADYTGFPEMLDGRVKTLHPKIHAGILARRHTDDIETLATHAIPLIDCVIVNLYPFAQTIAQPQCNLAQAIAQIDIGGPTLLRAAAKNADAVTVIVDPTDYDVVLTELAQQGDTTLATRRRLAAKTFAHTAHYDATIATYLAQQPSQAEQIGAETEIKTETPLKSTTKTTHFPDQLVLPLSKITDLSYGENPHQGAAYYAISALPTALASPYQQHQGKPLSYNNYNDMDTALRCVHAFDVAQPTCCIVKHSTPCGVAQAADLLTAYQRAYACDPSSSFGGIIGFNQAVDETLAQAILSQQFVEVVIAPKFTPAALERFQQKPNVRIISLIHDAHTPSSASTSSSPSRDPMHHWQWCTHQSGFLVQDYDQYDLNPNQLEVVTQRQPTPDQFKDLLFAWTVVRFVKSNAIVLAKHQQTIGIGTGQTSRVFSTNSAILRAQSAEHALTDAVLASDAFFPFPDSIVMAAQAGVTGMIQPGGSIRDQAVIDKADELGLCMVLTRIRHFRH